MKINLKRKIVSALLVFSMLSLNSYADVNYEVNKTYDSEDMIINQTVVQKNPSTKVANDEAMVFDNSNGQVNKNNPTNTDTTINKDTQTTNKASNSIENTNKYNFFEKVENSNVVVKLASQSKEELQSLYDRGFRVFEITVSTTRDGQLVLADNFSQYFE